MKITEIETRRQQRKSANQKLVILKGQQNLWTSVYADKEKERED